MPNAESLFLPAMNLRETKEDKLFKCDGEFGTSKQP